MPAVLRPLQLDWGDYPLNSALGRRLPDQPLRLFTRNVRYVYEIRTELGGSPTVAWREQVPLCSSDGQDALQPDGRPTVLGRGMGIAYHGDEEDLIFPNGRWGERGLAILRMEPSGARHWIFVPPGESGLDLSCHAFQEDFWLDIAVSDRFVFVCRGAYPGIAVYCRPQTATGEYAYVGSLALPKWVAFDASARLVPRRVLTFSAPTPGRPDAETQKREFLAVGVAAHHRLSLLDQAWLPRVVLYDLALLAVEVDGGGAPGSCDGLGEACQGTDAPVPPPPLNGFGDGRVCGQDAVAAAVVLPTSSASILEADALAEGVRSIAVGTLPGSTISGEVALGKGSSGTERTVLVFGTTSTFVAVDMTGALGLGDVAGDRRFDSAGAKAGIRPWLYRVPPSLPLAVSHLDGFGLSAGPVNGCGPPTWNQAGLDYPNLLTQAEFGNAASLAGRYAAVGWATQPPPGNALTLAALAYDEPDLSDFRMSVVGFGAPQFGLDTPEPLGGRQFETFSSFHHVVVRDAPQSDPSLPGLVGSVAEAPRRLRDGEWLIGVARTSFGLVGFRLPTESTRRTTVADYVTGFGGLTSPAFDPRQAAACSAGGGVVSHPTTAYPSVSGAMPEQTRVLCVSLAAGCRPRDLPANLRPQVAAVGPPDDAGNEQAGFGYEFLDGTVLHHPSEPVLLLADRGSNSVWAFQGEPNLAQVLDVRGVLVNARSVAAARWDLSGAVPLDALVIGVGSDGPALHLLRWSWTTTSLAPLVAVLPVWRNSSSPGVNDMPLGYTELQTIERSGGFGDVVVAGVRPLGSLADATAYVEGYDAILVSTLDLGADCDAAAVRIAAALQDPSRSRRINEGHLSLELVDARGLPESELLLEIGGGSRFTFFRFERTCVALGGGVSASTTIRAPAAGHIATIPGRVQMVSMASVRRNGTHWLFGLVQWVGMPGGPTTVPEFHLVSFRVEPSAAGPSSDGVDAACSGGAVIQQGNDALSGGGTLELRPVDVIPLPTDLLGEARSTEVPKLEASEGGDYLVAMGDGDAGCWLVDVDWSGPTPTTTIAEGLRKVGAAWRGWDATSGLLDRVLFAATATERGSDRYPVWPLGNRPSAALGGVCAIDRFFTALDLAQTSTVQAWSTGLSVDKPMTAADFIEVDGETCVLINTDPLTVWRVLPTTASSTWEFVGALCTVGRLRAALRTGDHVYFVGSEGAFAIPLEPTADGCCPAPQDGPHFRPDL